MVTGFYKQDLMTRCDNWKHSCSIRRNLSTVPWGACTKSYSKHLCVLTHFTFTESSNCYHHLLLHKCKNLGKWVKCLPKSHMESKVGLAFWAKYSASILQEALFTWVPFFFFFCSTSQLWLPSVLYNWKVIVLYFDPTEFTQSIWITKTLYDNHYFS